MLLLALACVAAGTFELHRYREKVHGNAALRRNAHMAAVPLSTAVVPLSGQRTSVRDVTFRRVLVSGQYLGASTTYLADQVQDGRQGFDVVTPLRTADGVVLVVRGFVAATAALAPPDDVTPPPGATVTVHGWLQAGQNGNDRFGRMSGREIAAVNPQRQSARLGAPVYDAYLTLDGGAPGTAGLAPVAFPSLSNPTGGAEQWQLASYVVQWYAFAVLAVLAPFLISRSEIREARRRFLGFDVDTVQFDASEPLADLRALPAGADAVAGTTRQGADVAVRPDGTLARPSDVVARRWAVAQRLADRYGRSLGHDATPDLVRGARPPAAGTPEVRDSRAAMHRSGDAYHGEYNDYLWELALADGEQPGGAPRDEPDRS
jgi:cytochrome oxidase assembly protein ShyY1